MNIINCKTFLAVSTVTFALCFGMATADMSQDSMLNDNVPSKNMSSQDEIGQDQNNMENMSIIDIVTSNPSFSTMAQALSSTDLVTVLAGQGPFTVFAPNDEAFKKLPPQTLKNLLKPENRDKLAALLTYHVVPVKIASTDLKNMDIKTVNGKTLTIQVNGDQVMINNAKVIQKDVIGTNGVIYTIDTVLMP